MVGKPPPGMVHGVFWILYPLSFVIIGGNGPLIVIVVSGENLPSSQPLCVRLQLNDQQHATSVKGGTSSPKWDERFVLRLTSPLDSIDVTVCAATLQVELLYVQHKRVTNGRTKVAVTPAHKQGWQSPSPTQERVPTRLGCQDWGEGHSKATCSAMLTRHTRLRRGLAFAVCCEDRREGGTTFDARPGFFSILFFPVRGLK